MQEVACLKRLLDDTGAAGALFWTLLLLMLTLVPPPPAGLLGLPLKLLHGQPHVRRRDAALVNP